MKRARPKKSVFQKKMPEAEIQTDREETVAEDLEETKSLDLKGLDQGQETASFEIPHATEAEQPEEQETEASETENVPKPEEEHRVTLEEKLKQKQTQKKKKHRQKLLILAASLTTLLLSFVIVMGMSGFFQDSSADNEEITEEQVEPVDKSTGKINILILGVDKDGLRTDTMIVASYDLDAEKVKLLSIPRDTRMYVGSRYQKINAAHAITKSGKIKGPQGSIEAVTRLTAIPINYYVEFSFDAFKKAIDALGGIDFYVPRDMNYEDPVQDLYIHLKEGQQHLDGDKAEQLVRFRRYPEGDIARVQMQQEFLKAVAEQKLNSSIITKLPDLFTVLKDEINTNFTLLDMTKYGANLMDLKAENVTMYQLPGEFGGAEYDASYWIADMPEVRTLVQDEFGYDAEKATNGPPGSKGEETKTKATAKATSHPEKTKTPSKTAKPSNTPEKTHNTRETVKPSHSATPAASHKATQTPTNAPEKTAEPAKVPTPKPTEAPAKTEEPEKTPRPARPTAKPTQAPDKE